MIRQRQRKNVEELYGCKFDVLKSEVTTARPQSSCQKPSRTTERFYLPINNATSPPPVTSVGKETTRRRTVKPSNKNLNGKHVKESFVLDDGRQFEPKVTNANVHENKTHTSADVAPHQYQQQQQHHHSHNSHYNSHDDDKDDGSDEFFNLIRCTVQSAIGNSISELFNRNFRDLYSKLECFFVELKNTNSMLYQMKNELNNKIGHYGEENSRHFRYLCMKSEYDKMFYQHQTLITSAKPPNMGISSETKLADRRKTSAKASKSGLKIHKENNTANTAAPCSSRSMKSKQRLSKMKEPNTSSSGDISQKYHDVTIPKILRHLQKYCSQMQLNDLKCDKNIETTVAGQPLNVMNHEVFGRNDDTDEDTIWDRSSDGMTPRNGSNVSLEYGCSTARGDKTHRANKGEAGDG